MVKILIIRMFSEKSEFTLSWETNIVFINQYQFIIVECGAEYNAGLQYVKIILKLINKRWHELKTYTYLN